MVKSLRIFVLIAISASQCFEGFNIEPVVDPITHLPWFTSINLSHQGRIAGGNVAPKEQFPHQVGLNIAKAEGRSNFCGGSLILDRWVVTAAHCTVNATAFQIILGALNIMNLDSETKVFNVGREALTVHEAWNAANLQNDIALLKLPSVPRQTARIKPIALPQLVDLTNDFAGASVIATGWGSTSDASPSITAELRYVESNVFGLFMCKMMYLFNVKKTYHICMGGAGGKSICNGDSGGPLITLGANRAPILIGVSSFGFTLGCGLGWPSVFTRVTSYVTWIRAKTST